MSEMQRIGIRLPLMRSGQAFKPATESTTAPQDCVTLGGTSVPQDDPVRRMVRGQASREAVDTVAAACKAFDPKLLTLLEANGVTLNFCPPGTLEDGTHG